MEEDKRKDKRKSLLMVALWITVMAIPFGISVYQSYEEIDNPPEDTWPDAKIISEDEQYVYYGFSCSHAKYDDSIDYINSVGGEITSEKNKARWWYDFEYRVVKA